MCHMPPKRIFKKVKILNFFKKGGLGGSKNDFFEKIFPKSKRALKNWVLNMCHMPPKKIFKKSQNFEFFSKNGG